MILSYTFTMLITTNIQFFFLSLQPELLMKRKYKTHDAKTAQPTRPIQLLWCRTLTPVDVADADPLALDRLLLPLLTLLSPPDTAKMLPVAEQETCQTTSSKVCSVRCVQLLDTRSLAQRITRQFCEQLAMTVRARPIDEAHATSRNQSE